MLEVILSYIIPSWLKLIGRLLSYITSTHERVEPTTSHKWTTCVWEIIGKCSRLVFFEKLDPLFFDPARWRWLEVTPLSPYSTKEGRIWSLSKRHSNNWFLTSGGMIFSRPFPLRGISFAQSKGTKRGCFFFGRLFIRLWQLMSGVGKSRWRLTKVAPVAARNWWNWWSIGPQLSTRSTRVAVCC